jgi:hypothetical protein
MDVRNGQLGYIWDFVAAAAGIGIAAMGLVDASKAFWGGPSNFGFGFIRATVERFVSTAADGPSAFGRADILETLKANWIKGVAEADQKAQAKALIHLRLNKGDAPALAALAGVDPAILQSVAAKPATGEEVSPREIAVLGQFDAVLSAALDMAYGRADQKYRYGIKLLAAMIAVLLAVQGGWLIANSVWSSYVGSRQYFVALLVGVAAAPLASVAKDLANAVQNTGTALLTALVKR